MASSSSSRWAFVEEAPIDPILGLNQLFKNDTSPNKVNLGVGAYRTDEGKPWVLRSVLEAEKRVLADLVAGKTDKEYIPIDGLPELTKGALKLILGGNSPALKENRVAVVQTLSGTGALRVGMEFMKKFMPGKPMYLSNPTWANHNQMLAHLGIQEKQYRYYDDKNRALDFAGMCADLEQAPSGSVILLHACAHNPTGFDPSQEQWKVLLELCKRKDLVPFFDCAYQGFASGDVDRDAWAVRYFVEQGMEIMLSQSFAKNFGMYGERIGAFSIVTKDSGTAGRVLSQLKPIVRVNYSSPQIHGARVVAVILGDEALYRMWLDDVKTMADRIAGLRTSLYKALQDRKVPGKWEQILEQIGMFSYTGLNPKQVQALTDKWHIYLTKNGRISMAGLTTKNLNYVADAIQDVVNNA
jgi:aspartate/tyrosine/aromatic aminotransferase